jgi:hypothetical protein
MLDVVEQLDKAIDALSSLDPDALSDQAASPCNANAGA